MASRWSIPLSRRGIIPNYPPLYRDVRLTKCESCRRVFTSKEDLKHHIALTHTGRKPHSCVICGKRYSQLHYLNSHFKLHKEPRLQEFAILKYLHKRSSEKSTPPNTTVGSFKVSKALKSYVSEPTFKSFGTLQSFTIPNENKPQLGECIEEPRSVKLPHTHESSFISRAKNLFNLNSKSENQKVNTSGISALASRLPDIHNRRNVSTLDCETQTLTTDISNVKDKSPLEKDYWVDTDSEWQTHISNKGSERHRTSKSISGKPNSVFSEPVSFKVSTPKEPRFWDEPDLLSKGLLGVERVQGYDPAHTHSHHVHKRHNSKAKPFDTWSSVTYSIYET